MRMEVQVLSWAPLFFFMDLPEFILVGERRVPVVYESAMKVSSTVRFSKGVVKVKLSRFLVGRDKVRTVGKFLKWAEKRLAKMSLDSFIEPEFKDGGRVVTHNKIYEIVVEGRGKRNSVKMDGGVVRVKVGESAVGKDGLKDLVEKAIVKDQIQYLLDTVDELNQVHFREKVASVRFKRTKGRFGSCSSKRNINISFRLLFAPREVFRYVCVHELAHLKQMNHSSKFWELVADACPDYKAQEKWLRENGFMLG